MTKSLTLNRVSKTFTDTNGQSGDILDNISLTLARNELVSIIGPSGCGKSTLLDCIAGITPVDSGEIRLGSASLLNTHGAVSYMMQDDILLPWRTVSANIMLPLEIAGYSRKNALAAVTAHLKLFGLEGVASSYPYVLSGGMKQRASLLRTYMQQKEVMLLDEPFGKLDALTRMHMQEWFLDIWQTHRISALWVTHDIDEAIFLSDRIYIMSSSPGKIADELSVPLPRPRQPHYITTGKFLAMKKKVLSVLSGGHPSFRNITQLQATLP